MSVETSPEPAAAADVSFLLQHTAHVLTERVPSVHDRRARIIRVTPKGARVVATGQQIVDRVHGDVLGALPPDERAPFVSALNRLATGHLSTPTDAPDGTQGVRRPRQSRK